MKFLLILLFPISLFAAECIDNGKIEINEMNKISKIGKLNYCYNKEEQSITSSDCLGKSCLANLDKVSRDIDSKKIYKVVGSPGHNLCTELKGQPQFIKYMTKKGEWIESDRCLFADGSFSSLNRLFKLVRLK